MSALYRCADDWYSSFMPKHSVSEFDRIIGAKLRYQISVSDMSDSDVASIVELPVFTLRRHARGVVKVNAEQLARYAHALKCDPGDLLPRLDSNQQPAGYWPVVPAQMHSLAGVA